MPAPRSGPPGAPGRARRPRRTPPAAAPRTSPACRPAPRCRISAGLAAASTRRRRGASVGRSAWLRRSRRRRMRRWVVTVTVLFFSQWIHRSRLCLTRERESLRREAKAQSVPKSGPYTSSLACAYAVNITTRRKPVLTHVHPPRTARDALRRPRDGRLAVICNSPATCDDRGAAAGYRCKRCVEGVLSCRVTARSGRTSAVAHCSAAAET